MKILLYTGISKPEDKTINLAKEKGINIIHKPFIKTVPLNVKIPDIKYDYLIITSKNSIKLLDRQNLEKLDRKKPVLTTGEKTAELLKSFGFSNVIIPEKNSAAGIKEYIEKNNLQNKRFLFLRAKKGMKINLPNVVVIYVYETVFNNVDKKIHKYYSDGKIHYTVFTSPSTFESFKVNFPDYKNLLKTTDVIPIGETTRKSLEKENIEILFVPEKPSLDEIIKKL